MVVAGSSTGFRNNRHRAVTSCVFPGFPPRWGDFLEEMLQPKQDTVLGSAAAGR